MWFLLFLDKTWIDRIFLIVDIHYFVIVYRLKKCLFRGLIWLRLYFITFKTQLFDCLYDEEGQFVEKSEAVMDWTDRKDN